jgi:hypothetical protein
MASLDKTHGRAPLQWPWTGPGSAGDLRADDQRREILVEPQRVIIRRALHGMPMSVAIPFTAFRGLGLCLAESPQGIIYELRLLHADSELSVVLSHSGDEGEAVGNWLQLADELGVPRLVERRAGQYEPVGPPIDVASRPAPRRRSALLRARHGRFALRRMPGVRARLGTSFAGEQEIISYE